MVAVNYVKSKKDIYIYMYVCVCMCMLLCIASRSTQKENGVKMNNQGIFVSLTLSLFPIFSLLSFLFLSLHFPPLSSPLSYSLSFHPFYLLFFHINSKNFYFKFYKSHTSIFVIFASNFNYNSCKIVFTTTKKCFKYL